MILFKRNCHNDGDMSKLNPLKCLSCISLLEFLDFICNFAKIELQFDFAHSFLGEVQNHNI